MQGISKKSAKLSKLSPKQTVTKSGERKTVRNKIGLSNPKRITKIYTAHLYSPLLAPTLLSISFLLFKPTFTPSSLVENPLEELKETVKTQNCFI